MQSKYMHLFLEIIKINFLYSALINLRLFGLPGLLKMPIVIQYGSTLHCKSRNGIEFVQPLKTNMLTLKYGNKINIDKGGKLLCTGEKALFNKKNLVYVSSRAVLEIGNNFWVNAYAEFYCRKRLKFGDDVLVSFHVVFLDTDYHPIFNGQNQIINRDVEVVLGNNVWIGCNVTILKGARVANNIIIGAGSLVTGYLSEENSIYCGNPVKHVKNGTSWSIMHPEF